MRILIIIPAYNEELTIGSIVTLARKYGDVLVVDDGSEDRTSEIASNAGAIVIRHDTNFGKSQALKTGFDYALSMGYEVIVTLDADGQHDPDEIPLLIEPIVTKKAEFVIGSRYLKKDSKNRIPLYRRIGLWVLNKGTKLATEIEVDSQSGFRAISKRALQKLNLRSDGYSIETDMIIEAHEKGITILEVPIKVRYDVPNKHKQNPIRHGFGVLTRIIGLISYKRPMLFFGVLSLISFAIASILAYWGLKPYHRGGHVYLTQMVGAGIFVIIGIQLFIAGLMLTALSNALQK